MFTLENGHIRFGHPEAREFLLNPRGEQKNVWYDVRDTAYWDIIDTCLSYLSLQEVQDSILLSFVELTGNISTLGPGYSLSHYSIQYWPEHYKRITKTEPIKAAVEFCRTKKAFELWIEAYWYLSNPMSRGDKRFLSILLIFASLGLNDLLEKWLADDSELLLSEQDRVIALAEAARNAHIETVNRLLELGTYNEDSFHYILGVASSTCDKVVIDVLIKYIAQRPGKFDWPLVLLCRVSQFGLTGVVERLLGLEVSFDTFFSEHKLTPIYLACRDGHADVTKLLLDNSISALSTNPRINPLVASFGGFAEVVQLLLDHGALINLEDPEEVILYGAAQKGCYMVIDKLTKTGCDLNQTGSGRWLYLAVVASEGFFESTKVFLANDISLKTQGPKYLAAFHQAVLMGHLEICRLLLESKGYPELGDDDIDTIFPDSVRGGNVELVELLAKNGANVNAFHPAKYNALLYASRNGYKNIVVYLLDNGADINCTDNNGQTPVLLAVEANHPEIVEVLAKRGADLDKSNTLGWPPLTILQESTASTRILLENGAKVNCVVTSDEDDYLGYTPLHIAVSEGYLEAVKLLLSFGATSNLV